ncbi:hypothetical protein RvY_19509, partial [Ramazzottius varieornatus]
KGQNNFYRFRDYLRTLSDGLGPRFPKKVIWANMRLDAVMLTHELLQIPSATEVTMYRVSIVGIDWTHEPFICPSPNRRTPYRLFVEGPERLQFRAAPPHEDQSPRDELHEYEFSQEMTRLGDKYSVPMTDDELLDLDVSLDFYFGDMKFDDTYPELGETVNKILTK